MSVDDEQPQSWQGPQANDPFPTDIAIRPGAGDTDVAQAFNTLRNVEAAHAQHREQFKAVAPQLNEQGRRSTLDRFAKAAAPTLDAVEQVAKDQEQRAQAD